MELRDLYDSKKVLTGEVIKKGDIVPTGRYYITVVVLIENDNHEFLLQKRVKSKDGLWAFTGGHPKSGESSIEGIVTEIKEELDISVKQNELTLFKTIRTDDDFVDIYYLKKNININDIHIQKEEVDKVMWASRDDIQKLINENSFSSSHKEFYNHCIDFLDSNIE